MAFHPFVAVVSPFIRLSLEHLKGFFKISLSNEHITILQAVYFMEITVTSQNTFPKHVLGQDSIILTNFGSNVHQFSSTYLV